MAKAAGQVANVAVQFYKGKPGSDGLGAVNPSTAGDASGIQWYESGIYWGALLDYARTFNDNQFGNDVGTALGLASFGSVGSFLGSNAAIAATLQGKWNDDIMWWGLAGEFDSCSGDGCRTVWQGCQDAQRSDIFASSSKYL